MFKPRILIVEDELLIAKDISMILENHGYKTKIGITSVEEALALLKQQDFDLVLVDIQLRNKSDGIELGRIISKSNNLPFIFVTSYSDEATINKLKLSQPNAILIKPYKAEDIWVTVSVVLNNFKHKYNLNDIDLEVPYMLQSVIQYIEEHIFERIEINQLTELTKWSHHHFIRSFKKYVKQSPYQYILERKIEKAKNMISHSDVSFTIIALELGFNSYSNFYNAFKRMTRLTPEIYRKQNIKLRDDSI